MAVYPVILCGGSGTRLWPASRPARPKQFQGFAGEGTLFEQTVRRVAALPGFEELVVVTGEGMADHALSQLGGTRARVLLEPEGRDSAPAMAAAAAYVAERDPEGLCAFVASDHFIPDEDAFREAVGTALEGARGGRIVTLGIRPDRPTSAYGYIRPGEGDGPVRAVAEFKEKPDETTAERYVAEGYLWNSGNFITGARTLLDELDAHRPGIADAARKALAEGERTARGHALGPSFRDAEKISIDFAVMERTDRAAVVAAALDWSDLGAWDAVARVAEPDAHGNRVSGEAVLEDTSGCYVRAPEGMLVAAAGVSDLAIVAEDDAVLVCPLDRAQDVKGIVQQLKDRGAAQADAREVQPDLDEWAAQYRQWLFGSALPVWWALGADHANWGWHEELTPAYEPTGADRRMRVQARQTWCYGHAGRVLGWPGPWRDAVWHGFERLDRVYRREDGLYRTLATADGEPADDTAKLYDQAFVMLALSVAEGIVSDHEQRALALLETVEAQMRHEKGGFRESDGRPYQSNAHMHLFEACLAWQGIGTDRRWHEVGDEIGRLALERFTQPEGRFLREVFDADWQPAPGEEGRIVEPGHQFEWAWLLARWNVGEAREMAEKLFRAGEVGVDRARRAALDSMDDELERTTDRARLWPQTERLKAAVLLGQDEAAKEAAATLWRYLSGPAPGLWHDKLGADDAFEEEPVTASSFYHVVAAVDQIGSAP